MVLFVLTIGGLAAAGFELWLVRAQHPKRWFYAYLAWTPIGMLFVTQAVAGQGGSLASGAVAGMLLGPIVYPGVRGLIWLNRFQVRDHAREEHEADLERTRYQATDFSGDAPFVSSAARDDAPAPSVPPLRVRAGPRPAWVKVAEGLAIAGVVLVLPLSVTVDGLRGVDDRRAMVEGHLATMGMEGARLKRDWIQLYCTGGDGEAYAWTSEPADGRACVRRDGVQIKVGRSRLTQDPFARPKP